MDLVTALSATPSAAGPPAAGGSDAAAGSGDGAFAGLLDQASQAPAVADAAAASAPAAIETAIQDAVPPPAAPAAAALAAVLDASPAAPADLAGPTAQAQALTVTPIITEPRATLEPPAPPPQKPAGQTHRAHRVDLPAGLQEADPVEAAEPDADAVASSAEPAPSAILLPADPSLPVEAAEAVGPDASDVPADLALIAPVAPPPPPSPGGAAGVAAAGASVPAEAPSPAGPSGPLAGAAPAPAPAIADAPPPPVEAETAPGIPAPAAAFAAAEAAAVAATPGTNPAPQPRGDFAKAKTEAAAAARGTGARPEAAETVPTPGTGAGTGTAPEAVTAALASSDGGGEAPPDGGPGLMRSDPAQQAVPGAAGPSGIQSKAAAETAAAPPRQALAHLTAGDQVVVHVARALDSGADSISIRLDPADLGRVDVTLDFGADGRVSATVLAEKPETLRLLQRDAQSLERAFADAGLKADTGGLNFGLRRDSGGFAEGQGEGRQGQTGGFGRQGGGALSDAAPIIPPRAMASMRALDIRI